MRTYKTGQKAPESGMYRLIGSTSDNGRSCRPTQNEKTIPLSKGETFPPLRSCESAARWKRADKC